MLGCCRDEAIRSNTPRHYLAVAVAVAVEAAVVETAVAGTVGLLLGSDTPAVGSRGTHHRHSHLILESSGDTVGCIPHGHLLFLLVVVIVMAAI